MRQYYGLLDGLRAYSILFVLISHFVFLPFVQKLGLGFVGVNLFFVISGFLITEILINDIRAGETGGHILKKFYWRRTLRIFPIYYLACIVLYLFHYSDSEKVFVYNLTYTTNIYNYLSGDVTTGFAHIWSLCAEEQFYLCWPLLLLFSGRHTKMIILAFVIIALGLRAYYWWAQFPNYAIFNYRMTPACLDLFGIGAFMAHLKCYHQERLRSYLKLWWLPVLAAALYLGNALLLHHPFLEHVMDRFWTGVFSFYLIGWTIYEHHNIRRFLDHRWLKYIGKISYGIYLYHFFVLTAMEPHMDAWLQKQDYSFFPALKYNLYLIKTPVYTSATILLAAVSFSLVEVRFLKLKTLFR